MQILVTLYLLFAGIQAPPVSARLVPSTKFGRQGADKWNPNDHLACDPKVRLSNRMHLVAHRTLPCGTKVIVYSPRTGRSVRAYVGDRLGNHRRKDGSYFSELDLAPATARAIRHNGFEYIVLLVRR